MSNIKNKKKRNVAKKLLAEISKVNNRQLRQMPVTKRLPSLNGGAC